MPFQAAIFTSGIQYGLETNMVSLKETGFFPVWFGNLIASRIFVIYKHFTCT